MKAIFSIAFIAKYFGILFVLHSGAVYAQEEQKKKLDFCFEVFDYVYVDSSVNNDQTSNLKDISFDFLLEQINKSKDWPLLVHFGDGQVIYYFEEPCSVSMKGFSEFISAHNKEFEGELMLVPTQNHKGNYGNCVFYRGRSSCDFGPIRK